VNFERNEITLRAEMTKTRTGRVLPIRGRLAAVLEIAHTQLDNVLSTGPAARLTADERAAMLAHCYVLATKRERKVGASNEHGRRRLSRLTTTSQRGPPITDWPRSHRPLVRSIDLHFHEPGSRLL
jgi:hypothetical protein